MVDRLTIAHGKLSERAMLESGFKVTLGVSEDKEERKLKIGYKRVDGEDDEDEEDDDMGFGLFD